jgi:hypothetical protein
VLLGYHSLFKRPPNCSVGWRVAFSREKVAIEPAIQPIEQSVSIAVVLKNTGEVVVNPTECAVSL